MFWTNSVCVCIGLVPPGSATRATTVLSEDIFSREEAFVFGSVIGASLQEYCIHYKLEKYLNLL